MGVEIERRFLVDGRGLKPWRGKNKSQIFQTYLDNVKHIDGEIRWSGFVLAKEPGKISDVTIWRIRLIDEVAILTGKGNRVGATASEFEWEIPIDIYNALPLSGLPSLAKTRFYWESNDNILWEIDEFEDPLSGIVIAEVELRSEDQLIAIPEWVGLEVTYLRGWSNASLSNMIRDAKLN